MGLGPGKKITHIDSILWLNHNSNFGKFIKCLIMIKAFNDLCFNFSLPRIGLSQYKYKYKHTPTRTRSDRLIVSFFRP